ncbi:hypothetical protein ABJI51_16650 [Amycolatopsis sp. NEAU-NG30]|uniref:Uncharacterized protein n=1 Tax=Amycolatopsis melonis TaxID=3156488 RepID=A0ABV0LEJ1_9PSEU
MRLTQFDDPFSPDPTTTQSPFSVPDPPPKAPPGLEAFGDFVVSSLKYFGIIAIVAGFALIAIMMALGRRNRSEWAAQGVLGLPYVIGAVLIVVGAGGIVQGLLTGWR